MKVSRTVFILLVSFSAFNCAEAESGTQASTQTREIENDIRRLSTLQERLTKTIEKNRALVTSLKKEREALAQESAAFEKRVADEKSSRYQSLAKVFEKMEPELAGEKLSKIKDPKDAALIIYNMKTRLAGAAMNYVDPRRASSIVTILTDVKRTQKK